MRFDEPSVTVDVVVFAILDSDLKVLLIQRKYDPYKNQFALPGVYLKRGERGDHAAKRALKDKANLKDVYLEQLYTFDDPKRDPRGRVITITYFGLVEARHSVLERSKSAQKPSFINIKKLPDLAFDHSKIIRYALSRLKNKIQYTNVIRYCLPASFTFSELQEAYELILDKKLDKRNFRKKYLELKLIKPTGRIKLGVRHRPAELYSFTKRHPLELKRFF